MPKFYSSHRTLSSATTPGQSGSVSDGEKVLRIPKAPALLEPNHIFCHIGILFGDMGGDLTPLQRSS